MTFPYITEDGQRVRCHCKGCGEVLWTKGLNDRGNVTQEITGRYGALYFAMSDAQRRLSEHSTPCCPDCAKKALSGAITVLELNQWFGADIFHWFVEGRVLGLSPKHAEAEAVRHAAGRYVVSARSYDHATT